MRRIGTLGWIVLLLVVSPDAAWAQPKYQDSCLYDNNGAAKKLEKIAFLKEAVENGKHVYVYELAELKGAPQSVETWKIDSIRFGGMTGASLNSAIVRIDKGQYDQAIQDLQKLLKDTKVDETTWWLPSHARFYIAEAYAAKGDMNKAAAAFEELLTNHPQCRFAAAARYDLARVLMQQGQHDKAKQSIDALLALGEQYGAAWPSQAKLLSADAQFAADQFGPAGEAYQSIAKSLEAKLGSSSAEVTAAYSQAMLRAGACLIKTGKMDDAARHYDRMKTSTVEAVQAGGYLGLGKIQMEKEQYRTAVLDFLRAYLAYPNLQTSIRAEAALGAATCYTRLYKKEKQTVDGQKAVRLVRWLDSVGEGRSTQDLRKELGIN